MERAASEARNAYYREWRKNNKDRVKAYNENYWNKKAQEQKEADNGKTGK